MSQSTTVFAACDVSIWLDDINGTPRDISGSSNSVTLNFDHEIGEYTSFGGRWPNRLECGKDAAFDIVILYSLTANEGADIIIDWFFTNIPGPRTASFYFPDKDVGSDLFRAEVLIEHWDVTGGSGSGDPVEINVHLVPTGEVTHTTAST